MIKKLHADGPDPGLKEKLVMKLFLKGTKRRTHGTMGLFKYNNIIVSMADSRTV